MIGAGTESIRRAEDRRLFKETMEAAGLDLPRSSFAYSVDEALAAAEALGYPVVIRPSYVMGGGGSGVVTEPEALKTIVAEGTRGCRASARSSSKSPSRDGKSSNSN